MKPFESTGLWFLPDDPDTQVPGTITFSKKGAITLKLSGTLQQSMSFEVDKYPTVRGAVSDNPYGRFISLFNCFATHLRFGMPGAAIEHIHADHGFAGADFVESASDAQFDTAAFYFSSLAGWLNFSGLKHESKPKGMVYSWEQPEHVECSVDDAIVYTGFEFASKGGPMVGSVSLEEHPALMVGTFGLATMDEIHSRFFSPLSHLMAFASDGNTRLERYALFRRVEEGRPSQRFDRLFAPAIKYDTKGRTARASDQLFTFGNVKGRYEAFMQKWFSFTKQYKNFCSMFFSYGYEQHGFLETRFLFLMLAAECLVREDSIDDPVLGSFEVVRDNILKMEGISQQPFASIAVPTAMQLAMPTLFGKFIKKNWALISDVAGTTEERFIETLFATFDLVNTRRKPDSRALGGIGIYHLLERLRAVLKICVLKLVDFTDEEIVQIVARNAQMSHVKSDSTPWGS